MSRLSFNLKRLTSLVLALLMIAGTMVLTMGSTSIGALPKAEAQDDPPTPGVNLTLKKEYDGTGHGTENQTFINNWNGYQVGDNTPNDGIVATNDTVGYSVELSIEPGPARTFNLAINTPEYLELVSSNLCDNGPGYTVTGSGEQCTINVQEGANLLATRQITLKAKSGFDSNVSPEQVLTLEANKNTLSADPVKIVQSPRVDLTVTGQSSTVVYR